MTNQASQRSESAADGSRLPENTQLAAHDCAWCGAKAGCDVHSPACPLGERSRHIRSIGGVPWPKGKPLLDPDERARDHKLEAFIAEYRAEREWLLNEPGEKPV